MVETTNQYNMHIWGTKTSLHQAIYDDFSGVFSVFGSKKDEATLIIAGMLC